MKITMVSLMKVFIVLTHVAQVVLFGLLFYLGNELLIQHYKESKRSRSEEIFTCNKYRAIKKITQYSDYWVVWNFVKPEQDRFIDCAGTLTIAMQGSPAEIYHIESLYKYLMKHIRVSFAVHLNTTKDLKDAIDAMHYIHSCIFLPDDTESAVQIQNIFAREYVAFHLYFHQRLLEKLPLPLNIDFVFKQSTDCAKYSQANNTYKPNVTNSLMRHVIIGKNIAQLATGTRFLLHLDSQTWPVADIFTVFLNELRFLYFENNELPPMHNVIYRLPVHVMKNMEKTTLKLRSVHQNSPSTQLEADIDKLVYNLDLDTADFLLYNLTVALYPTAALLPQLQHRFSYFITYATAPLYDDRHGLNLLQSENLRLLRFALSGTLVALMRSPYVLHNITEQEATANHIVRSRFRLNTINKTIIEEYHKIFDPNSIP